ncbi:hypothetical protein Dsin_023986 [Dipteronia sinensis]|uniref:C2H2-type domain-containing protein n=1 Tax=Dipteronia sinensis TaxID=43782 RepID=A0AAE0A5X6_9ROSI|nr:hypothetical protein Dsin_023986 [Dipteronia sinensis]
MGMYKYKLCLRTFSGGRALGGHMTAHRAARPLRPKTTNQQQQHSTGGELEEDLHVSHDALKQGRLVP